eukprot:gene636-231_t
MPKYDIVVFSPTSDSGYGIAISALKYAGPKGTVAFAGRNMEKVLAVKDKILIELSIARTVDFIAADVDDYDSMVNMTKQAKVLCTSVGPFGKYGEPQVKACIESGCHYVDITGEIPWVNHMRNKYSEQAEKAGVSIISFAAFDSLPSETGMYLAWKVLSDYNKNLDMLELVFGFKNKTAGMGIPRGTAKTALEYRSPSFKEQFHGENDTPFVGDAYKANMKETLGPMRWFMPMWSSHVNMWTVQELMSVINAPVISRSAEQMGIAPFRMKNRLLPPMSMSVLENAAYGGSIVWEHRLILWGLVPWFLNLVVLIIMGMILVWPITQMALKYAIEKFDYHCKGDANGKMTMWARGTSAGGKSTVDIKMQVPGDVGIYGTGRMAACVAWAVVDSKKSELKPGFGSPVLALHKGKKLWQRFDAMDIKVDIKYSSGSEAIKKKITDI